MPKEKHRCAWSGDDPAMIAYHDQEWGVPVHDDRVLFEFLILEGAQAGLSWRTILNRRETYRSAFSGFDAKKIAKYTNKDEERLLADPGIIRNKLKISGAIQNAKSFLAVQKEFGSFDAYVWRFVDGKPINRKVKTASDVPAVTSEAQAMSKDMIKRGFKFVGPTICYAFMQAVGMVNDHELECFRHKAV
jgi:DNA-3-methyladenine glycosylase I